MYVKCLKFNDLVTVTVIFLKIAVCLMLLLNTKPWFIIGGWLLLSSAINWTSIRFMVILTIFCSGLSPHLYQVVALSNRNATDVVRILLTISPTAIKHCGQTCWQTLVYSTDYTNTYYHPALSHIKTKNPYLTDKSTLLLAYTDRLIKNRYTLFIRDTIWGQLLKAWLALTIG